MLLLFTVHFFNALMFQTLNVKVLSSRSFNSSFELFVFRCFCQFAHCWPMLTRLTPSWEVLLLSIYRTEVNTTALPKCGQKDLPQVTKKSLTNFYLILTDILNVQISFLWVSIIESGNIYYLLQEVFKYLNLSSESGR